MRKRTWFGVQAVIEIRGRSLHRAGIGRILFPHPPLVNYLLRFHLPDEPYRRLSVQHEFGHFQVAPLVFIYALIMALFLFTRPSVSLPALVILLISIHATWEMLAEGYVRLQTGIRYSQYYRSVSPVPRIIFWIIMAGFTALGWIILWSVRV